MNKRLWFCLIVIATLLLAGCGGGGGKFEEASQIYAIEADSPTQIGDLVKISEAELTEGVVEMGAVEGRLLEYASDTDYVLVMAYRFDSPDLAGQAFQKLEGGTEVAPDFYEIEAGYYRCLVSDAIYLASGSQDSVITVIGGVTSNSSQTAEPSTTAIKSSNGSVGAFAYDWWWSKERSQDGRYGETSVTIDLPKQSVSKATLHVSSAYSQQSGSAQVTVYISAERQVTPPDADHDRGSWWVGNTVTLGQEVGNFETYYGNQEEWSADITSFIDQNIAQDTFYIAFENQAYADVGVGLVYIEVMP